MIEPTIVYLHGFNSSPQSTKAQQFAAWAASRGLGYHVPILSYDPKQAIISIEKQLKALLKYSSVESVGLVGSSLGGYYALYLAEQFGLKAVVINPAMRPYELLHEYLGDNKNIYTHEPYVLTEQHIDDLRKLKINKFSRPQDILCLLQTADEVLDYQQAVTELSDSLLCIEPGGDHSFQDFQRYIGTCYHFLFPSTDSVTEILPG